MLVCIFIALMYLTSLSSFQNIGENPKIDTCASCERERERERSAISGLKHPWERYKCHYLNYKRLWERYKCLYWLISIYENDQRVVIGLICVRGMTLIALRDMKNDSCVVTCETYLHYKMRMTHTKIVLLPTQYHIIYIIPTLLYDTFNLSMLHTLGIH